MKKDKPRCLRPTSITVEALNNCIEVANHNLRNGQWIVNNVIVYCGVNGVTLAGSKKLIERVQNCIVIDYTNKEYAQYMDSDIIEAYHDVKDDFVRNQE